MSADGGSGPAVAAADVFLHKRDAFSFIISHGRILAALANSTASSSPARFKSQRFLRAPSPSIPNREI
ncbi:MAG: hypothetical protein DMG24_03735 [Acidobacteria bacterium]|nr:MAG: hypothetical protein DMG24_03735 [Acidobacteriota bacterium]